MHLDLTIARDGFTVQMNLCVDSARRVYMTQEAYDYIKNKMVELDCVCARCNMIVRSFQTREERGRTICADGVGCSKDVDNMLIRPSDADLLAIRNDTPIRIWMAFLANLQREPNENIVPKRGEDEGVEW